MKTIACFGLALAGLFLAGCCDNNAIRSAKSGTDELAKKMEYLSARVAAVEDACRQLHDRVVALENHVGGMQAGMVEEKEGQKSESAQDSQVTAEKESRAPGSLTQSEIRLRIKGMTPQQVKKAFGNPGKVKESSSSLSWDYDSIAFQLADGTPGSGAMLVVFENGEAAQVIFHENVEYKAK